MIQPRLVYTKCEGIFQRGNRPPISLIVNALIYYVMQKKISTLGIKNFGDVRDFIQTLKFVNVN